MLLFLLIAGLSLFLIDTTPDEGEEIKESSKTDLTGDQQDNDDKLEDVTLVSQEHQQLQHMVAKTLNDQMKTLKVILSVVNSINIKPILLSWYYFIAYS